MLLHGTRYLGYGWISNPGGTYDDIIIPQNYPSWLENSWLSFYGNGWVYGCIKADMQVTEICDADGNPEPVFWLAVNYNGNGLFRFKNEAIDEHRFGNSSYNKYFFLGSKPRTFYIDEPNGHIYYYTVKNRGGLYRFSISDMPTDWDYHNKVLIDGSPVRHEGSEEEIVGVPQLSVDDNGEYLYWCYRAPTSSEDYRNDWVEYYNESNPLHRTGIKRIKLGEANPKVEIVAEGVEGYGVVAINYKAGQHSANDIINDSSVDAPVEYYNLQGVRINNPQSGSIVIRRQGDQATKIRY